MKEVTITTTRELQEWFDQDPAKIIGKPTKKWTETRERRPDTRPIIVDSYSDAAELIMQDDCAVDFAETMNNLENLLG